MDPNKIEKQILEKLNMHQPQADYDQLWDKLESRLAKRKKRRLMIWLFFGIGLLLSYIIYTFGNAETQVVLQTPSNILETHPNLQNPELSCQGDNYRIDHIKAEAITKSNIKQNTFKTKSSAVEHFSLFKGGVNTNYNVVVNEGLTIKPGQGNEYYLNKLNEKQSENKADMGLGKPEELVIINQSSNHVEEPNIVLPTPILSVIIHGSINSLGTNLNASSFDLTSPKNEIKQDKKWVLFLTGKVNYAYLSVGNNRAESDYLQNAISPHAGYGIETNIMYLLSKKVKFVAGINWSTMVDKFVYNKSINIEKEYYNPEAFILGGNFIGANQFFSKNTEYDVLHYNLQNIGSLHTGISFSLGHQWYSEFLLNYIAFQNYSGRLLKNDLTLVKDGPIFNKTLLTKWYPSVRFGYEVNLFKNHRMAIFCGFSPFRYTDNIFSPLQAARRSNFEIGISSEIWNK